MSCTSIEQRIKAAEFTIVIEILLKRQKQAIKALLLPNKVFLLTKYSPGTA